MNLNKESIAEMLVGGGFGLLNFVFSLLFPNLKVGSALFVGMYTWIVTDCQFYWAIKLDPNRIVWNALKIVSSCLGAIISLMTGINWLAVALIIIFILGNKALFNHGGKQGSWSLATVFAVAITEYYSIILY